MYTYICIVMCVCIYIYIYISAEGGALLYHYYYYLIMFIPTSSIIHYLVSYVSFFVSIIMFMDTLQRGVQWIGGAVDGGSIT